MIVDDAALMRTVIADLLQSTGDYEVIAKCQNGQQALDDLKRTKPDIILLDIEMPVMDGLTFIRHARLRTRARIVVLSSVAGMGAPRALEAWRLGADAVVQKPSGSVSLDLVAKSGHRLLETLRRVRHGADASPVRSA